MSNVGVNLLLDKSNGKRKPVYQQMVHHLKKGIRSRTIKPGEYLPPIAQLVKECNVGYSTVNSAFKALEVEGLISRDTKWGKGPVVLEKDKVMKKCAIVFARWCGTAQFIALEKGIRQYTDDNNIGLATIDAMGDNDVYLDLLNHLPYDAKGVIVYPFDTPEYEDAVSRAINNGIKVVFADRVISGLGASSVSIDHFAGACEATTHLIKTHDRPVYYFGNTDKPSSSHQRFQGYLEAMHEAGCETDKNSEYIIRFPRSEEEVAHDFRQSDFVGILSDFASGFFETHNEGKYSILGVNDDMARGVCTAAEEAGLKIGQDVFVCGFGNKPYCEKLPVPLTSVDQFDEQVGYEAARLLHDKITGKQKRPIHLVLPPELHIRQSSTGLE